MNVHATGPALDEPGLKEYTASGGDWAEIAAEAERIGEERIVVNMGPVHPSTHGVLRLVLDIEGEVVKETRVGTGFLHTGIEKNMEYRTWVQGVAFATRMDYVAPMFNEVAYCLAVEKLLGITDQIPERASQIRVLMMELNRISSHLVAIGSGGNELGATTMMTIGFRGRENVLRIFEKVSGLRMNHAYIRPGGVAQDLPPGTTDYIRELMPNIDNDVNELMDLTQANPIFHLRHDDIAVMTIPAGFALSYTGPGMRAAGYPLDIRKIAPYCGYEKYDFDVSPRTSPTPSTVCGCASRSASSPCGSSTRCWTNWTAPRASRSWWRTSPSPGPRSCPSARMARATRWSTSARSWASPWSP